MKTAPQPLAFKLYGSQIIGARPVQEDSFGLAPAGDANSSLSGYIVVSDGVGGEADGELASKQVETSCMSVLSNAPKNMGEVVYKANEQLAAAKKAGKMHPDACATLVAVSYGEGGLSWASVGDSLLILRDVQGKLRYLNKRHIQGEYLKNQFDQNVITEAEYRSVPKRDLEAIYSCMSGDKLEYVDLGDYTLSPGERVLIGSDGILSLGMEGIAKMLDQYQNATPEETVRAMLDHVQRLKNPKQDNTTVVILDYGAPVDAQHPTPKVAAASAGPPTAPLLRKESADSAPVTDGNRLVAAESVIGDSAQQEDSICHFSNKTATFAVVADGAGGHRGGALASKLAVRCAKDLWESVLSNGLSAEEAQKVLYQFLLDTNEAVRSGAVVPGSYENGRSAIAILYTHADYACVANAGDCRVYVRHANGEWQQLTQDDSILALALRAGDVAEEDAWQHPDQCSLTQALGIAHALKPHVKAYPASPQDMFLVCCDGFWNQLRPERWKHVPLENVDTPAITKQWAESAVYAAAGKSDNVSIILVGPSKQGALPVAASPRKWLVPVGGAALLAIVAAAASLWFPSEQPLPHDGDPQLSSPGTTVDPQPVDPQPADPQPVDTQPVDPQPVDPQPVDPQPVDPQPVDPQPVDPQPADPQPVDPQPVDPQPVDPQPATPRTAGDIPALPQPAATGTQRNAPGSPKQPGQPALRPTSRVQQGDTPDTLPQPVVSPSPTELPQQVDAPPQQSHADSEAAPASPTQSPAAEQELDSFIVELMELASNGDPKAQYELAECYLQGRGLPKSKEEAVFWFRKAANQGHNPAKQRLRRLGY